MKLRIVLLLLPTYYSYTHSVSLYFYIPVVLYQCSRIKGIAIIVQFVSNVLQIAEPTNRRYSRSHNEMEPYKGNAPEGGSVKGL